MGVWRAACMRSRRQRPLPRPTPRMLAALAAPLGVGGWAHWHHPLAPSMGLAGVLLVSVAGVFASCSARAWKRHSCQGCTPVVGFDLARVIWPRGGGGHRELLPRRRWRARNCAHMESYTVLRRLGKGAFGEVHLVRRVQDGDEFALKRTEFAQLSAGERKATMLEVSLLGQLHHPNIIGIFDHFHDGDDLCMVLELAPNGDLDGELRRHRKSGEIIPEERLMDVLAQVGGALHYAHSCRVLHRDMKPANVLLVSDGSTRLADFGISCNLVARANHLGRELKRVSGSPGKTAFEHEHAAADSVTTLQGTPFYMAPELFSADLHLDGAMFSPASDVTPHTSQPCFPW